MSSKTTRMSIDIPPRDHKRLKMLANAYGLSLKEFVLRQLDPILHPKKPPNRSKKRTIQKIERREGLISCKDVDDLLNKLDIE